MDENTLCWERVCTVLRDMGNNGLADKIHTKYIRSSFVDDRGLSDSAHSSHSSSSRQSSTNCSSHCHYRNSRRRRRDSRHQPYDSHINRSFYRVSSDTLIKSSDDSDEGGICNVIQVSPTTAITDHSITTGKPDDDQSASVAGTTIVPMHIPPDEPELKELPHISFLTSTCVSIDDEYSVFELFVPSDLRKNYTNLGNSALIHYYTLYEKYEEVLSADNISRTLADLRVANEYHSTASICPIDLLCKVYPRLCFILPKTYVPLRTWVSGNHSVQQRHLILQKVVNTFAMLFKSKNGNLSFWGSAEVWISPDHQVYLYIDFIKALAVQLKYVKKLKKSLPDRPCPRIEDCKMLSEMYNTLLKPFILPNSLMISPQLRYVYDTFERMLENPEKCVSDNLVSACHVLGSRKICRVMIDRKPNTGHIIYFYCLQHENLSAALQVILKPVLPPTCPGSQRWAVYYADTDATKTPLPVYVTDVVAPVQEEHTLNIHIEVQPIAEAVPGAFYM